MQVEFDRTRQASRLRSALADIALVFVGGACGGLLRVALATAFASPREALPWITLAENVGGALLLGALFGCTTAVVHRRIRLLVGTGALGSFTTYSTFAVEVHTLAGAADFAGVAVYLVSSLVLGLFAAFAGIRLGVAWRTARRALQVG